MNNALDAAWMSLLCFLCSLISSSVVTIVHKFAYDDVISPLCTFWSYSFRSFARDSSFSIWMRKRWLSRLSGCCFVCFLIISCHACQNPAKFLCWYWHDIKLWWSMRSVSASCNLWLLMNSHNNCGPVRNFFFSNSSSMIWAFLWIIPLVTFFSPS